MRDFEVAELLATAAAFDRREVSQTDAEAWHAAFAFAGLGDLELVDAKAAVAAHYARTRDWLMPADVVGFCKRIRRERLKAAGPLHHLVQADPDNGAAYNREYQQVHSEVAAGRRSPAQLEAGPRD